MTDLQQGSDGVAIAEESVVPGCEAKTDKKEWAERVVSDILRLMNLAARLEVKDAADGGISMAVFLQGEVPGVQPGKRSHVIDALQFLANKMINRPQTERRWISIGVGGHPEPRPAPAIRMPTPVATPSVAKTEAKEGARQPLPRERVATADEMALEVSDDPILTDAAKKLAERSARLGRYYGIVGMSTEDRARVVKAVNGMIGIAVRVEGEGRNRRIVFVPEKPAPLPKKVLPIYDVEDDELPAR